jgi:NADPH-dependent ferric siderophore reductase
MALELDVDFVLHEVPGFASDWVREAQVGDRIGVVKFGLSSADIWR